MIERAIQSIRKFNRSVYEFDDSSKTFELYIILIVDQIWMKRGCEYVAILIFDAPYNEIADVEILTGW